MTGLAAIREKAADLDEVWTTVERDLPRLRVQLEQLLVEE